MLKLEPLYIGLILLPGGAVDGFLGPFVGRLYDRVGPKPLVIPAMFLISVVLWAMTLLGTDTWWPLILVGYLVMCTGFSFLFGPLFTLSLGSVKPRALFARRRHAGLDPAGRLVRPASRCSIAVMASRRRPWAAGSSADRGAGGGIRTAFLCGAIISLFAMAAAFFMRRAPDEGQGGIRGIEA